MKKLGILGVTLLTASALWASDAEIKLTRVQQRYPWNGMVDIDFTIAGVDKSQSVNYYVQFKLTPSDGAQALTLREFVDESSLYDPESGDYRVTWNSAWEDSEYRFISKQAKLQAELVFCNGDKSKAPYGIRYTIIDLSNAEGPYSVEEKTIYGQGAANDFFNNDVYKTTKIAFRRVRANTFTMGAPNTELGFETSSYNADGVKVDSYLRETQHEVTLTANYLIGVFPLTRAQYGILEGTNVVDDAVAGKGAIGALVSWPSLRGAVAEAKPGVVAEGSTLHKLNSRVALSGSLLKFDLPTEAQWECACRAGTTGAIYTNVNHMAYDEMKNIAIIGNTNSIYYTGAPKSTAVGSRPANPWGLYDMLGMVSEICLDLLNNQNHDWGADSRVDPLGSEGTLVVLRGGSYYETKTWPGYITGLGMWRSAARMSQGREENGRGQVGCRLACTLP